MARYEDAGSKALATARMYLLAGRPVLPLGPGSKEKKSALEALGSVVGLDLDHVSTKIDCGRRIAHRLNLEWDESCFSTGDSITLMGLNRILTGVILDQCRPGGRIDARLLHEVIEAEPAAQATTKDRNLAVAVDVEEVRQNIVEQLVLLTEPGEAPNGVTSSSWQLQPHDISFEEDTWRDAVVAVQDWLRLSLDVRSASHFDASLAVGLGLPSSEAANEEVLLPRLDARLGRALALREKFVEQLDAAAEGGATQETASQAWLADWDAVDDERESETSGPIHAAADTWSIQEFVQQARDNALNLSPSYQRADVWPTPDAQQLIESVIRGIPLPSVILLQSEVEGLPYFEVVDGKQRLTSILRFMGQHPRAVAHVERKAAVWGVPDLLEIFQRDYPAFKKIWKKHSATTLTQKVERELYFPFPLRGGDVPSLSGDLEQVRGKYYSQIRDVIIRIVGEQRKVRHVFEQASQYKLPVIVYKEATSDQVHEVFSLYNKQGKHLNAEEIRNALFHRLDVMKAVLVTAGDSDDVEGVAPFLLADFGTLKEVGATLERYGFGQAGYKRSKVISWVLSVLFYDNGSPEARSTASQINEFFKAVMGDGKVGSDAPALRQFRKTSIIIDAMSVIGRGLEAHSAIDDENWAPRFKNSLGKGKWQELQLIPALVALTVGHIVLGDDLDDRVEARLHELTARSATWTRPSKTQTKVQWQYIAAVVRDFLDVLGIDVDHADHLIRQRFGSSGLAALSSVTPMGSEAS